MNSSATRPRRVALSDVEQAQGGVIEQATAATMRADISLRWAMIALVGIIFLALNFGVVWLVYSALQIDIDMLRATKPIDPADRLITPQVIMALIGATVVQTGLGFIAITSYLFPKRMAQ